MKILLAIDPSACSEMAIEAVLRQFAPATSDVRVLHVDEWPKGLPLSYAFGQGSVAASQIVALHEELGRQIDEMLARTKARLNAAHFRAQTEVRHGDARHEILECAAEWRPDVIVLGSHGRRGASRFLLGSVSESVVRQAACSVEVVRDVPESAHGSGAPCVE